MCWHGIMTMNDDDDDDDVDDADDVDFKSK